MLIKFSSIIEKYGKPNGIIHIGAHLMEEREDYLAHNIDNIIWIEANPEIYKKILENSIGPNEKLFNYTISDKDNEIVDFHITNNGQSSSILELDKHKIYHPSIFVTNTIKTNTKRMDSIILKENINIQLYNFLNIDIQGAELLAIKGFGKLLNHIKYIYTEINKEELYTNCAKIEDIDKYLVDFDRVETSWTNANWGDALYVRK
jgi:FkbM family methyltransferase